MICPNQSQAHASNAAAPSGSVRRTSSFFAVFCAIAAAIAVAPAQAQNSTTTVSTGTGPLSIAVNTVTNQVYVINSGSNNVTVIDGSTNATATVAVGTSPASLAVNSVTNQVYVSNTGSNNVTVIDGSTNATTTVKAGILPTAIVVNPVTNQVYVTNLANDAVAGDNSVTVIDGSTNATTNVPVGLQPNAAAVNTVTDKIYVLDQTSQVMTIMDGATNALSTVDLLPSLTAKGSLLYAVAVNQVTNQIYVLNTLNNSVSVIDGVTHAVTNLVLEIDPASIAVNSVTNQIYVPNAGSATVSVIDGATNAITTLPVGNNPVAVAVNPATNTIYIANFKDNTVTVLDGATNASTTVATGQEPSAIAVNPVTNKVYVANFKDNTVTVIDAATQVAPLITAQPASETMETGSTVVFNVSASGSPAPTYQWSFNGGAISGATTSTLVVSGTTSASAGSYTCTATNASGSVTSSPATLTVEDTTSPGRLINISARAFVGTGGNVLIAGFVVEGSASLPVLVRSSGPALLSQGVTGVLPDPQLQLYSGSTQFASNAGWAGNAQIASTAAAVGATAWTNPASLDSALLESLSPGGYTGITSGVSGDTGVSLAEVYDATPAGTYTPSSPRLINISARAFVGTGGNVLIAGFVIAGSTSKTVLIRASGPALLSQGVTGVLSDPEVQLYSGSTVIASNAGWGGNAQIEATAAAVGATAWTSPSSLDSALLVTLPPGGYTAIISGASGDTGVSLAEVYDVP